MSDEEKQIDGQGSDNDEQQPGVIEAPVPETKRSGDTALQKKERLENLARVDFRKAVIKDIVSPHSGSILANDGPVVPLSDDMLEAAKGAFWEYATGGKSDNEGEAEANNEEAEVKNDDTEGKDGEEGSVKSAAVAEKTISFKDIAFALFKCGATPIDPSLGNQEAPTETQTDEGEGEKDEEEEEEEEEESPKKDEPVQTEVSVGDPDAKNARLERLVLASYKGLGLLSIGSQTQGQTQEKESLKSLDEQTFLSLVSHFYAPKYYYGQRMRRATGRGCTEDVLDLVSRGCDVNTADGEGLTSLHYASEFNRTEFISAISDFCSQATTSDSSTTNSNTTNTTDSPGNSNGNGNSKGSLMLNPRCKAGWTPLYCATHHNNVEVVQLLLKLGADVSIATKYVVRNYRTCWCLFWGLLLYTALDMFHI